MQWSVKKLCINPVYVNWYHLIYIFSPVATWWWPACFSLVQAKWLWMGKQGESSCSRGLLWVLSHTPQRCEFYCELCSWKGAEFWIGGELLLQVGRGWSGLVSMELRTVGLPVAAWEPGSASGRGKVRGSLGDTRVCWWCSALLKFWQSENTHSRRKKAREKCCVF